MFYLLEIPGSRAVLSAAPIPIYTDPLQAIQTLERFAGDSTLATLVPGHGRPTSDLTKVVVTHRDLVEGVLQTICDRLTAATRLGGGLSYARLRDLCWTDLGVAVQTIEQFHLLDYAFKAHLYLLERIGECTATYDCKTHGLVWTGTDK